MRDRETIEIAMEAAETGHLVMSTLPTIDASKTVEQKQLVQASMTAAMLLNTNRKRERLAF